MQLSVDLVASRKIRDGRTNINPLFYLVGKRKILLTEKGSFCFLEKWPPVCFGCTCLSIQKCFLVYLFIYYQLYKGTAVLIYTL